MTRETSLLTRTLKVGSQGEDVRAVKRTVYRYLANGKLKDLIYKPLSVQRTYGPLFAADVVKARKKAGFDLRPIVGPAFFDYLADKGAPDALAVQMLNNYRDAHVAPLVPKFVHPIPESRKFFLCQGLHQTSGIPGNWAIDLCVAPNTPVLACEAGRVTKLSGHSPLDDTYDSQGVYGWSIHFESNTGYRYFVTHLGYRTPLYPGAVLKAGSVLGTVGDQKFRPDHVHYGCTSSRGSSDAKNRILEIAKAPRV